MNKFRWPQARWRRFRQGLSRLAKRRATAYWLSLALAIAGLGWFTFGLWPLAREIHASTAPRLPWLRNNPIVYLQIQDLDHASGQEVVRATPGLPVYRVRPEYRLVGMAERVAGNGNGNGSELAVGIFPQEASNILFEDSRFELRFQAPSLALLYQDLMDRHGPELESRASALLGSAQQLTGRAFDLLLPALEAELGEEVAQRLWTDPMVRETVKRAFLDQVAQVDGERLLDAVAESPEMSRMVAVAVGGIAPHQVIEEFLVSTTESLLRQSVQEWNVRQAALAGQEDELRLVLRLMSQASFCLVDQANCMRRALGPSIQQGLLDSGQLAIHQGLVRLADSKSAEDDVLSLSAQVIEKVEPVRHLQGFVERLREDPYLGRHLAQYGDDAMDGLLRALSRTWREQPTLREDTEALGSEATRLAQVGLRELMLDQRGEGPNPFLSSLLREQLQGKLPPQIFVYPGAGVRARQGHRFALALDRETPP